MGYQENYSYWKNHKDLDPSLREELEKMSESQIEDAFFKDVKFETAGMRGLMGVGSNRLNIHTVRKATQGLANYLNKHKEEGKVPSVAIAYDNRYNSREFAFDCAKLLASNGIKTYVFDSLKTRFFEPTWHTLTSSPFFGCHSEKSRRVLFRNNVFCLSPLI